MKKKDSVTPPDMTSMTERKTNFGKQIIEDNSYFGNHTERSQIFNTTRRSFSRNPPTLEEAKVPLNSAKRAMRKIEKSLDSQVAGTF
jgi:hypothetical protein